jgi:hypothetical protein
VSAVAELRVTGAAVTAATITGGSCTTTAAAAVCGTVLAVGASAPMTLTVNAATAGDVVVTGSLSVNTYEANAPNNAATMTTPVGAAPVAPPSGGGGSTGGGGGGGRLDWLALALLAGALVVRSVRLPPFASPGVPKDHGRGPSALWRTRS